MAHRSSDVREGDSVPCPSGGDPPAPKTRRCRVSLVNSARGGVPDSMTALSRADKTKPFWVKLAHRDLAVIEIHDHRDRNL